MEALLWTILVLLVMLLVAHIYEFYVQARQISIKEVEIMQQNALKQNAYEELISFRKDVSKQQLTLFSELSGAQRQAMRAVQDRQLLVEMIKMIWDARDTEAAAQCVKNLIGPSDDGKSYTVQECYTQIRQALGFEGWGVDSPSE